MTDTLADSTKWVHLKYPSEKFLSTQALDQLVELVAEMYHAHSADRISKAYAKADAILSGLKEQA